MKKIILSAAMLTAAFATAQNTGIGTTAPTQKLDVAGTIRSRGNIMQDGYDFIVGQGNQVDRGNSGGSRAIVKGNIIDAQGNPVSQLIVNYSKDFPAGVSLRGNINAPDMQQGTKVSNVVVLDDNFNLVKVPSNSWAAANAVNIYNSNGTLTADRTVDQNSHLLSFTNGNVEIAKSLFTNGQLELSNTDTGDRTSFIDFHSSNAVDYNTRIYRDAGANGDFVISNTGTGKITLNNQAYVNGNLGVAGMDFILGDGNQTIRGNSGASRALVKNGDATNGSQLYVNFANDYSAGTRIDSKLFISNTSGTADAANDKVLTLGTNGEVKNSGSTLAQVASSSEPWLVQGTSASATLNTQNIYQSGNVMANQGRLQSVIDNNEGGTLQLQNNTKTGSTVNQWNLYNMTGPYGNGLNFWRYTADGSTLGSAVTFADNGNVGIGTMSPLRKLHIENGEIMTRIENSWSGLSSYVYSNNPVHSAIFGGMRGRGTIVAPQYPQSGDILTEFSGRDAIDGYTQINKFGGGYFRIQAAENFTADSKGTKLTLGTTSNGQAVPTDRITVVSNGNVGLSTSTPTQRLDVEGNARVRQMPATNDEATYSRVVVADTNGNLATVSRTDPGVPNATETIFQNSKTSKDILPNDTFLSVQNGMNTIGQAYFRYNGTSITLPPGKWIIYDAFLVSPSQPLQSGSSVWFRGVISNDNIDGTPNSAAITQGPQYISVALLADTNYITANGVWMIDNNTGSDKTYYVKTSLEPRGFNTTNDRDLYNMSIWAEDYLFAIKRK